MILRHVHSISVHQSGQIVPIDLRLPSDATVYSGLHALATAPGVPSTPLLGEYALEFEGKHAHPISFVLTHTSAEHFQQHKPALIPLSEQLENGMITGYYRDLGHTLDANGEFQPYTVRFTFELRS